MDIEHIKRKRQKSVQDQNAISKHKIFICARNWLEGEKLPKPIEIYFSKRHINRENSLLVSYFKGSPLLQMDYSGLLLTNNEVFIDFEFELDKNEKKIEHIETFRSVELEVSAHLKGTGKSFGCLCLEVLHEIRN